MHSRILRTKPVESMLEGTGATTAHGTKLAQVLTTVDLISLGVGSCVGTGMYVVSGLVAKEMAGPGVIVSFIIAAVASILSGKCLGAAEGLRKACLPGCSSYNSRVFSDELYEVAEDGSSCFLCALTAREFRVTFWFNCSSFPFRWFFDTNNCSGSQPSPTSHFPSCLNGSIFIIILPFIGR